MTRLDEVEYNLRTMVERLMRLEKKGRRRMAAVEDELALSTDLRDMGDVSTFLDFTNQGSAPTAPPDGVSRLYLTESGISMVNSLGVVTLVAGSAPAVSVRSTATQAAATNVITPVTFELEDYDTGSMHSTVSNTNRLVAPVGGVYHVWGVLDWQQAVFPTVAVMIRDQAGAESAVVEAETITATPSLTLSISVDVSLVAGNWVELAGLQTNVASKNMNVVDRTAFGMHWVRPTP